MTLKEYHRKRRFGVTPEPIGRVKRRSRRCIFVVQKHNASRLHYDFRVALSGLLVSWALPKGPSMNPADKRLAIRTEDHPLEYAKFEGVIPAGQYGAGTVMVWDLGPYASKDGPPGEQLARGKMVVTLQGTKLRGGFTLIQTGIRPSNSSQKQRWMLIKQRDEYADASWNIENPRFDYSVLTGRSLKEIEENGPNRKSRRGKVLARTRAA
jgi:bifunctional non-homologous end joining protein LigD